MRYYLLQPVELRLFNTTYFHYQPEIGMTSTQLQVILDILEGGV